MSSNPLVDLRVTSPPPKTGPAILRVLRGSNRRTGTWKQVYRRADRRGFERGGCRRATADLLSPWDLTGNVVQLESAIRWDGRKRCAPAAPARGRERQAEAAAGRVELGQPRSAGPAPKKCLTPAAQREAVHRVQERLGFSERHACSLVGIHRPVARWVLLRGEGFEVNHKRVYR